MLESKDIETILKDIVSSPEYVEIQKTKLGSIKVKSTRVSYKEKTLRWPKFGKKEGASVD